MIDLFALAAMLARVSTRVEDHGVDATAVEREILRTFARQAKRRVDAALAGLEENEDAGVQALASHVLETGRYGWDNL
jgi:tRNA A-37 threonylcarbamoyl transferase component Bud32